MNLYLFINLKEYYVQKDHEQVLIFLPIIIIAIPVIIALIDILKSEFEGNNKIIWVLVVLFLWLIGAILYYFIGRNQKIKKLN